jgi:hypothetical protein
MALRDYLIRALGGAPLPPKRTHTIAADPRLPLRNRTVAPGVRVGSWVRWEGRTAIVTGVTGDGLVKIDLVNDAGETVLETHQPWGAMRKATMSEIPESRRPKDVAVLRRLGYVEE